MGSISPETQQNILITIYLFFSHNFIAIVYFTGLLISIILALYRPSRSATLLLLGFAILLFSFEYNKHIVEGLKEQTITSIITTEPHYRLQRLINILITKLLPIVFFVTGWACLLIVIFKTSFSIRKKKTNP